MALADQSSGDPPAVTHEMLVAWRKLAGDINAALTMGGEQGKDLLFGLMAEWCEAVEDVNTARQICVDLAASGRRDEAIQWHADGFFDVADRLDPERPGWEEWEVALAERGAIVPRVDHDLKDMADRMHEELQLQDISGRPLAGYLDDLRRNVLSRGHYGERLTLLESIRMIDPAGTIWEEMISPIRRKRAGEIAGELAVAMKAEDFVAISRLSREFEATDWGGDVPPAIRATVEAASNWQSLVELRRVLADSTALLISRIDALRALPLDAPNYGAALREASEEEVAFKGTRDRAAKAAKAAAGVPDIAARIRQSGLLDGYRKIEQAVQDHLQWLGAQKKVEQYRQQFIRREGAMRALEHKAPLTGGSWDAVKKAARVWMREASEEFVKVEDLRSQARIDMPPTTSAMVARLQQVKEDVQKRLRQVVVYERCIIGGVVGGLVLVVLVVIAAIVVRSAWK